MTLRVMLIFPRMKYQTGDPPIGMCSIAANLRKNTNAEISLLDLTFKPSLDYVKKQINSKKPDIVGIYTDTLMFNDFVKVAKIAKKKGIFVFVGGPHPTVMPDTVKPYCDMIALGEAEETLREFVNKYPKFESVKGIIYKKSSKYSKSTKKNSSKKGAVWIRNPPRPSIENLDTIEYPAFDLIEMDEYMARWHPLDAQDPEILGTSIIASRGCPYNCSFCQPTLRALFGDKVRHRSPKHVVGELKQLKKLFNITGFFLQDDTFNINKAWVKEFCSLVKKENLVWGCNARVNTLKDIDELRMMHDAGLRLVHIGVESGSQRILNDIYRKGIKLSDVPIAINNLKKIGIYSLCFFMLGAPTETKEEIRKTIRFAVSLNATEITATIVTPLPGTKMYDIMKGTYTLSTDFSQFDYYSTRAFEDENLTFKELKRYQLELLIRFYVHPKRWSYILKHFTSIKGLKKMVLKIRRFI